MKRGRGRESEVIKRKGWKGRQEKRQKDLKSWQESEKRCIRKMKRERKKERKKEGNSERKRARENLRHCWAQQVSDY